MKAMLAIDGTVTLTAETSVEVLELASWMKMARKNGTTVSGQVVLVTGTDKPTSATVHIKALIL